MFTPDDGLDTKFTLESQRTGVIDEPPFHILMLGNWSGASGRERASVSRPVEIDRDNFDQVMERLKVHISLGAEAALEVLGRLGAKIVRTLGIDGGRSYSQAFRDIHPVAPTHILVIPKRHIVSLAEVSAADAGILGQLLLAAHTLAGREGVLASGFRTVFNSGANAGQSVFHLHLHVLAGRAMHWPPG